MALALRVAPRSCARSVEAIRVAAELVSVDLQVDQTGKDGIELVTGGSARPIRYANPIMRYLAGIFEGCAVGGATAFEEAQVDSWLEYVQVHVHNLREAGQSLSDVGDMLEKYLASRTFMVGQRLTLADVAMAT